MRAPLILLTACAGFSCAGSGCASDPAKAPPAAAKQSTPVTATTSGPTFYGADGMKKVGAGPTAGTVANRRSPLGTNLATVNYSSRDWVFVDAFKMSDPWVSRTWDKWDDKRPIELDERGWVKSLESGQMAATIVPTLGGGEYVVVWEGEGEIHLDGDAKVSLREPGRLIYEAPANREIVLSIQRTNPVSPLRNIRVLPGQYATKLNESVFHPRFLDRLRPFRVIRFMDWGRVNGSSQVKWKDRALPTHATQAGLHGVAFEYMADLANALGADPWICVPHQADDDYVENLAKLLRDRVGPTQEVYVEYSNELWNEAPEFTQSPWVRAKGLSMRLDGNAEVARLRYQALRSAEIFAIFERVFGGTDRLVRVIGGQVGNEWNHKELLRSKAIASKVDAIAVAPYFGGKYGDPSMEAELSTKDGKWLLEDLKKRSLPAAIKRIGQSARAAKAKGIALIAYEGGQHLVAAPSIHNNPKVNELFDGVNRAPQMHDLYVSLLAAWREAGGQTFVHFTHNMAPSKWGRWGALERQNQPREEAPKYDALLDFAEANPRWW